MPADAALMKVEIVDRRGRVWAGESGHVSVPTAPWASFRGTRRSWPS